VVVGTAVDAPVVVVVPSVVVVVAIVVVGRHFRDFGLHDGARAAESAASGASPERAADAALAAVPATALAITSTASADVRARNVLGTSLVTD
jgi:hypothetical protein